jgi:hypothetical protein
MPSPRFWIRFWRYGGGRVRDPGGRWSCVWSHQARSVQGRRLHNSAPISAEQGNRGRALRVEIERLYVDMKARGASKAEWLGRGITTDTITKYVPVGSSFEDAEAVLRAAGCVIHYPAKSQPGPLPWDDDVWAQAVLEHNLIGTDLFDVNLTPRSPGDYAVVATISAHFDLRSL